VKELVCAISPCPNDTFAFHGLLGGEVRVEGLELKFEFHDIEELNRRFRAGKSAFSKVSFAALRGLKGYEILSAGAALGSGVGPLLLARAGDLPRVIPPDARVLLPGEHTTAALLFQRFHGQAGRIEQVVFSEILPRLARGEADYGVCIHEGRFTYAQHGLSLIEDLGARWEGPLPLGGLVLARERLPQALGSFSEGLAQSLSAAVRRSILYARGRPQEALETMRRHAREQSDAALWKHVELYVSDETEGLRPAGRAAIAALLEGH